MLPLYVLSSLLIFGTVCNAETYKYVEDYFDQKIDHYNFVTYGNQTYKQRFIYNNTWWDKQHGPIFFYAGNEGNIVDFWDNTGFIFKAAKAFNALVVFAEHRYYGKSLPFGADSFKGEKIGLLSINQAMADYAFFLRSFKKKLGAEKTPVIAFGGSYGGMLAAYMRFKYPNIIHGAIAASAPLLQVAGELPGDLFFQKVSKDFSEAVPNCEFQTRFAFTQLQVWSMIGPQGLDQISKTFHLCSPLQNLDDYDYFLRWVRNAFASTAMVDYPYPATFMGNLPAFPVKVMCNLLLGKLDATEGLYAAISLVYNQTQDLKCFDIHKEFIYCADPTGCGLGTDSTAWDYQVCTEIGLEASTDGVHDMFPVLPFTSAMRDAYCLKKYNVLPRRDYLETLYWGGDIASSSNIVFSNGNLDPWGPGGITKNLTDSVVAVMIDGGAHHLDLREDNPMDPQSVRDARDFELRNIQKWLKEYHETKMQ